MDYTAQVDTIRSERLDLVELLAENRREVLDTLSNLVTTSPSITLQDFSPVLDQYRELKNSILSMLKEMDHLEQKFLSRMS